MTPKKQSRRLSQAPLREGIRQLRKISRTLDQTFDPGGELDADVYWADAHLMALGRLASVTRKLEAAVYGPPQKRKKP